MIDLKTELRQRLAGSSSQQPVDSDTLTTGHRRRRVEDALMAMYHAQELGCCLITKHGITKTVWWLTGAVEKNYYYGRSVEK